MARPTKTHRGGSFRVVWKADRSFGKFGVDRGLMLAQLGERALAVIQERTDRSTGLKGKFPAYSEMAIKRDERGNIERDENGKWIRVAKRAVDVTLRSARDVPDGRRMRDALKVSPKMPRRDAVSVWIKAIGSRKDRSEGAKSVPHWRRAQSASGFTGRFGPVRRDFLGLTPREWGQVVASITTEGTKAFLIDMATRQIAAHTARLLRRQRSRTRQITTRQQALYRAAEAKHEQSIKRLGISEDQASEIRGAATSRIESEKRQKIAARREERRRKRNKSRQERRGAN